MSSVAGYSGTPLPKKLGFEPGTTIYVETTPDWYSKFADDNQLELSPNLPATHAHLFITWQQELEDFLKNNDLHDIEKSLWVSWPKKASKVPTDVTEQTFRDMILPLGWVDIKVAAIDDTWSGLKFTRRKI